MQSQLKIELNDIISGKIEVRFGTTIQAIASYLREGAPTSEKAEHSKQIKEEETKKLRSYSSRHNLWVSDIDFSNYVSEGAEQKVYLKDSEFVFKLNDGIYYTSWLDYFYNLLLHNFFFEDTAYALIGFTEYEGIFYAVVQQSFVTITQNTELEKVKEFMNSNGFVQIRNNDYLNKELGIILEDLHDENVLTKNNILYFIDTVFYITPDFWHIE